MNVGIVCTKHHEENDRVKFKQIIKKYRAPSPFVPKCTKVGLANTVFSLVFLFMLLTVTKVFAQDSLKISSLPSFRDCPECPEMVVLPAGSFLMGENKEAFVKAGIPINFLDLPQHSVTIKSFAIAKYDVTKREFAKFVQETGYQAEGCKIYRYKSGLFNITGWVSSSKASWKAPGFDQSDQHPVVCVSWDDTKHYVLWLNAKLLSNNSKSKSSQYHYRLPSEAEWEYAARAGTKTLRFWGDGVADQCHFSNGRDLILEERYPGWTDVATCKDGFATTSPVGWFPPNNWGLYDMIGNVNQWIEDCWNFDYTGSPTNGVAWESGDCTRRVERGSAWNSSSEFLISADRNSEDSNFRESDLGFRLAREVH